MRVAAIGIGSNSLRMLIADVARGRLRRLHRYREGLRVFAALDPQGNITAEMMDKACRSVGEFVREAKAQRSQQIHLFATSAVRDAGNQAAFAGALEEATGLPLEICSGDLEARLSFVGATDGGPRGSSISVAAPRRSLPAAARIFTGPSACRWGRCACAACTRLRAWRTPMKWQAWRMRF